ncbi:hypothetical protein K493DRAFT_286695 [Basidiobolus meristosporus CBS 931.73]|uniref:Scaffold protein Tuba n=1 Tax=Basidiobolus meristosporus CBS 931.73 TaxID=1314790 RepID=A0A1Y1Y0J5_9FUNG|nr:hypothetical protein K493DRAFT_286695 [Basidiobolus meristosporus CBS 931.73]|eukprot:ORX91532.1 hypothetical protein K493DRAFT_286695 [Basidiobolus meristosporus CBS 931.73]
MNRPRGYTQGNVGRVNADENVLRNLNQLLRNRTTSFSESTPDITMASSSPIYKPSPPLPGRPRSYSSESLSTLPSMDSAVSDQEHKNKEKRSKVIQELVDTEVSYLNDLRILDKIYYQQAQKSDVFQSRDLKTLFCNLPEVIVFTEEFCELLRAACSEPSAETEKSSKWVGEAFSLMMGSLETVYCNYCKAHESAVIRLNELQSHRGALDFFESCKEEMKGQTTSWDFGSLLIKPVQRVLKYPLLLQQILVLTPESDPDFNHLKSANQDIQKVAERINEIKKRKDIVETIVGIKKKEVVLSHGINKRISRRTQQIKQKAGLQDATTDVLFDVFLAKFEHQQCQAKNLVTQVESWKSRVQEYLDIQMKFSEMMERMYAGDSFGYQTKRGLESQVKEYRLSMTKIYMEAQRRLDSSIKSLIIPQVEEFLALFQKPHSVIKKREHKLLDYDRARGIKARGDKPDAALEKSANDYLAINAQLQDELPKFFGLTTQYFNVLVQVIASIQASFYQGLAQELEHVHQFLIPHGSQSGDLKNIIQDYHQSLENEGGFHHQLNEIQILTRDNASSPSRASLDSSSINSVPLSRTLSQSSYLTDSEVASRFESTDSESIKSRQRYPSLSVKLGANRVQQPMARSVSQGNPPLNFKPPSRPTFDDPFMAPEEISSQPDSNWSPDISPKSNTNITVSPPLPRRSTTKIFKCTVIYPFQAEHPDEIDLSLGAVLLVSKTEGGEAYGAMWYGEDMESGQIGWFPSSHCTPLE